MSDELIEAMARAICRTGKHETGHGTCSLLCMEALGNPRKSGCHHAGKIHGAQAKALLPVIRAHLEPTSEMVEAALAKGKAANLEPPLLELMRKGLLANWRDMLAASPIGDVG